MQEKPTKPIEEQINCQDPHKDIYTRYIGKYVICRSRNEGVNAGYVVACDHTGVILREARRLYSHAPADRSKSWYEGVALTGLSDLSTVGSPVEKLIVENYSLTVCTEIAEAAIKRFPEHKQS